MGLNCEPHVLTRGNQRVNTTDAVLFVSLKTMLFYDTPSISYLHCQQTKNQQSLLGPNYGSEKKSDQELDLAQHRHSHPEVQCSAT